jgi:PTH1 family peptidyl-tRNA hydrolase
MISLLVGLGNPGREYSRTRHNVGFMLLDRIAAYHKLNWQRAEKWKAEVTTLSGKVLMKPQTYMNLSGESVGGYCAFYKIPSPQVLVILDDVALPLGRLRIRTGGSAGGHNGLKSILQHLGTDQVLRLRIGIGAAAGDSMTGHVLGRFSPAEEPALETAMSQAWEAVDHLLAHGVESAMNRYNPGTTEKSAKAKTSSPPPIEPPIP